MLGKAHPQEIYNTGCTLDNPQLLKSYTDAVLKIKTQCEDEGKHFMADPKAFVFMMDYQLMTANSSVSGPLVSIKPTGLGKEFLKLDYDWLESPLLLSEPAASDKMVDLEAAMDFNRYYYNGRKDLANAALAEESYQRIKKIQRQMKRNMPFVYRQK